MPGIGGISVANNLLANAVGLNLNRNQAQLQRSVSRLSSGLRINTAADDPSGLAIAETLKSQVNGFDQAVQNVQNASNAATVADGALQTTTDILQRIRSLAVEASSDITSDDDKTNLQTEVTQLLLEVNRISQNTSFNGIALLDGSHSGFVPAQASSTQVTTNAILSNSGSSEAATLVASSKIAGGPLSQAPPIDAVLQQAAVGSGQPETVPVSNAAFIQPGQIFSSGNALATVQSVDAVNGTITATFSQPLANGSALHAYLFGTSTNAVTAGTQVMNLGAGYDAGFPLYAGEALQIEDGTNPEEVTIQKVLSPTSFLANFSFAHAAGTQVFNYNESGIGASGAPQTITLSFGAGTTPPPVGTPAYVEESSTGFPATGATVAVVATGSVTGQTPTSETILIPAVPNLFGGSFFVITAVGNGDAPLVPTVDGTIQLQVVNTGASIGVQETFYDTAAQTSTTSPYLLAPGESAMLFDGVLTTLGNFATADVGVTSYIKVLQGSAAVANPDDPALNIQSGATEGATIQLGLEATNTGTLRIANTNLLGSAANVPSLGAEDAIGQVDFALQQLLTQRAQLGAQIVRLNEDADNDNIASVNLQASESAIRDLNIGAETTNFNRLQIISTVGTSVLAQANSNAQSVLRLFP